MQQVTLTQNQVSIINSLRVGGTVDPTLFDGRAVFALRSRGFVKTTNGNRIALTKAGTKIVTTI